MKDALFYHTTYNINAVLFKTGKYLALHQLNYYKIITNERSM